MIVCQACGTENPDGALNCSKCARKLDPETQQRIVQQRTSHTATGIDWSRVAVAVVILVILALVIALLVL
jgi:uncharacterized membrane protein YvbJ